MFKDLLSLETEDPAIQPSLHGYTVQQAEHLPILRAIIVPQILLQYITTSITTCGTGECSGKLSQIKKFVSLLFQAADKPQIANASTDGSAL